jgi:polyhydroxybutyrate depolymerase
MGTCLVLGLGACSGSGGQGGSGSAATTSTTSATSSTTTAAAGHCELPAAGSSRITPTVGGRVRTVIVHVPSSYNGTTRVPLVLNLHGSGSDAAGQEALSGMDSTADAEDFIVAYPQGLIPDGDGYDWNVPGVPLIGGRSVPAGAADDVAFLVQLVGLLEHRYCIDSGRVYATGFSGGARMASQLACDASDVIAAVAPVSGLRHPTPCPATRGVPVVAFHGTADPVDPYDGNGQAYWTYSVPEAARDWSRQNDCSSAPTTSRPDPGAELTSYSNCRDGADVELYSVIGEGHEWPGGPPIPRTATALLGPQSDAVDANATMWAFFVAHPLTVGG